MYKVIFKKWQCNVLLKQYSNNRTAITLEDADGEPIATATVNLPDEPLEKDEVFIKNWSENEGMLDVLITAGIIGPVIEEVPTGFVKAQKCKLLIS
jgi:hypothetical protein